MNRENRSGIEIMTFEKLNNLGIRHGFSTKKGGVSSGVYESMNLGFGRGDSDDNVRTNYQRMAAALMVPYESFCLSQQTHTTNVRVMGREDAGNGLLRPLPYKDVDGMITNDKNLTLVTFYADCVPLYFYDPVNRAIGLSHSGWRGTVGKIGKVTIELMGETYGSKPEDIICCIGPSICRECYEVSEDVAEEFKKVFPDVTSILAPSKQHPEDKTKYSLDLWEANRLVFLESGIREENIEVTDYCTRCNPELFYSHRVMGANRGSLAAFMSCK